MSKLFPETLTRLQYLLRLFIVMDMLFVGMFGTFLLLVLLGHLGLDRQPPRVTGVVAAVVMGLWLLLVIILRIQMDIARLRSIGWSPWWVLLHLVPVANLILVIFLFFGPPVNDASDDSARHSTTRTVLTWLVAVLLIPAAVGGPVIVIAVSNFKKAWAQSEHNQWLNSLRARGGSAGGAHSSSTPTPTPAPASAPAVSGADKSAAPAAPDPTPSAAPAKPVSGGVSSSLDATAAAAAASSLHLDSIAYQSQHPSRSAVVINGNSLMVDDTVGVWRVSAISSNNVTLLDKNGESLVLWRK